MGYTHFRDFGEWGGGGERILVRRDLRMGRHSLKGDKK